jgi:uncharacterized membrane protein
MTKGRLETFVDAIIAIIMTIMVLELHVPAEATFVALWQIAPKLLSYLFSFLLLGIYWNNHHHMFHAVQKINGAVLWASLHLLFWLSLIPFATAWLGEAGVKTAPVAIYGVMMVGAALAYYILVLQLLPLHSAHSAFAIAVGRDVKGKASLALNAIGLALAFILPVAALAVYVLVAVVWLVPDPRFERSV